MRSLLTKMRFNGLMAVTALAFMALISVPAQGALTIHLTDSSGTVTCVGTTFVVCSTSDAAYTVVLTTAIDNSPGGPAFMTKTGNVTSTAAAIGNPLTI